MRQFLKYLSVFCCSLLLVIFFGQITGYTPAQTTSKETNVANALAYSSDGKLLVTGVNDGRLALLDTVTSRLTKTLSSQTTALPITGVAFKPKSNILASVSRNSTLQLWDASTGKQINQLTGHENPPRAVAFRPDGNIALTAGEDTRVAVWDVNSGKLIRLLEGHRGFINGLAVSPDGTMIASASSDRRINLWNANTGTLLQTFRGHANAVNQVVFSRDNKFVGSVSDDGTARIWDIARGTQRFILDGPTKALKAIAISADGTLIAVAGKEQKIFLYDLATGKLRSTFSDENGPINALAFNPASANTLASSDEKGNITIWDTSTGRQQRNLQLNQLLSPITTTVTETTDTLLGKALKTKKEPNSSVQQLPVNPAEQTLIAAIPSAPNGPILVITNSSNKFGDYYAEILRTEGLNEFSVSDISSVSATTLANYDLVILAEIALTPTQVTIFTDWVNSGGNLIAMHPDKQLANLLGLTDAGSTLANGYLLVNTSQAPGKGIVNQTIQFHGTADRYTLNGAASIATLYTNATTATTNPAVTLRSVGSGGGKAAAFTYDLARSIVYTRQGNPAWAGEERDGCTPIRSNDMFYGGANNCDSNTSSALDWVDLNKVAIPQADEQQRLLANLILEMNLAKKPLPRFWYFPHSKKAVVLMSGDDHASGGTAGRFDQFKAASTPGCSVDDWQCIRGTSYIYPNSPLTDTQANQYVNVDRGFEVALHVNTGCADYTPSSLDSTYTSQLSSFTSKYTDIEAPKTQRHHCLVWSDWSSTPEVELSKGIRLDTTYYYWPPSWITDRPGFFTGSGMTMRLAKEDGTVLDVFKSATQLTDESGQSYPYNIDTLLDRALGAEGYYGIFNVNAHTDNINSSISDAVVNSAKTRGVPVISARQLLTWLDGRDNSYFSSVSWSIPNNTLSFSITKGTGTNGLQTMLPTKSAYGNLTTVTRNGSEVTYTTSAIKGIDYAFFSGDAGSYVATYVPDTTPPQVDTKYPDNGATNISVGTSVTVLFNEAIDSATINSNAFELRNSANALVAATYTYNEATRTAVLTPNTVLANNTVYTVTLKGGTTDPRIKDLAGNALAANVTWSFTTSGSICSNSTPCTIWGTSTPATPSTNDTNAVELGVKFRSNINGYITGIRFYKGNTNTGNYIVNLWNTEEQNLSTATNNNLSASGWRQVNFSSPVPITANTTYIASYYTSIGRYAINNNYFTTNFNNGPLTALSSNSSGGNGVYKYGTSGFPNDTYQASNYWVDVVFSTTLGSDTTPPTVTTTTPSGGATGVSTNATVQATFSESMNVGTISTTTFELRDSSNNLVPAAVTYNAATFTATLTPSSPLTNSTVYTATVQGGSSGVKDQANNALAANYTWSFTTASTTGTCPQGKCTIWDSSAIPAVITDNDPSAVTLGVKFRSNVNGYIKGIRFYKGPQNTGTHVGVLWSSTGSNLAQATFTNETPSGWQEVTFSSPIQITANTVYVAAYHTTSGYYSQNNGYFAASGVDNLPLRALSDGESGPNGVYKYGSFPAFPDFTWNSTNYWVDVVFDTAP